MGDRLWRSFNVQSVAYCGAIDRHLKDLRVMRETRHVAAMHSIHMDLDTRALSAQLCHMVRMVCQECAQKLLGQARDPRAAVDEFEVLLRRYGALPCEGVSEALKAALVQKGNTDDALKTHLVLHASRHSNFQLVREKVRSVLVTQQPFGQGPMAMDIGVLDAK